MAKTIASIADGRVVPWFSEDPVPAGFVVVPPALLEKFTAGQIADGIALAKAALSGEAGVGKAADAAAPAPAPAKANGAKSGGKKAVEADFDFGGATQRL